MPIDVQVKLYLTRIRPAFLFGIKILKLTATNLKHIDRLQHSYLTSIIGGRVKINGDTVRIILGVPKLSDFIIKLKLSMYYDIFRVHENEFTHQIRSNYAAYYRKYVANNRQTKGVPNKWAHITEDYIKTLDRWNVGEQYKDVQNLPDSKSEWMSIIEGIYRQRYRNELTYFLEGSGRIISLYFGKDELRRAHERRVYGGFLDELKHLYNDDISTTKTSKSIKVLFNWTRLNHLSAQRAQDGQLRLIPAWDRDSGKLCPFCGQHRFHFVTNHLLWNCPMVEGSYDMLWVKNPNNFTKNIAFLEGIQARIDDL